MPSMRPELKRVQFFGNNGELVLQAGTLRAPGKPAPFVMSRTRLRRMASARRTRTSSVDLALPKER